MELLTELGVTRPRRRARSRSWSRARAAAASTSSRASRSSTSAGSSPGSLGGIVMIQVIEHLSPQHVIDFVGARGREAAPGRQGRDRDDQSRVALHVRPRVLGRSRPRAARCTRTSWSSCSARRSSRSSRSSTGRRSPTPNGSCPLPGDDPQTQAAQRELRTHRCPALRRPGLRRHRHSMTAGRARADVAARRGGRIGRTFGEFGIHQILAAASPGDAITNVALEYRDVLRQVGPSEVFARHIAPELGGRGAAAERVRRGRIAWPARVPRVDRRADGRRRSCSSRPEPIVLVYHNITPAKYFDGHRRDVRGAARARPPSSSSRSGTAWCSRSRRRSSTRPSSRRSATRTCG